MKIPFSSTPSSNGNARAWKDGIGEFERRRKVILNRLCSLVVPEALSIIKNAALVMDRHYPSTHNDSIPDMYRSKADADQIAKLLRDIQDGIEHFAHHGLTETPLNSPDLVWHHLRILTKLYQDGYCGSSSNSEYLFDDNEICKGDLALLPALIPEYVYEKEMEDVISMWNDVLRESCRHVWFKPFMCLELHAEELEEIIRKTTCKKSKQFAVERLCPDDEHLDEEVQEKENDKIEENIKEDEQDTTIDKDSGLESNEENDEDEQDEEENVNEDEQDRTIDKDSGQELDERNKEDEAEVDLNEDEEEDDDDDKKQIENEKKDGKEKGDAKVDNEVYQKKMDIVTTGGDKERYDVTNGNQEINQSNDEDRTGGKDRSDDQVNNIQSVTDLVPSIIVRKDKHLHPSPEQIQKETSDGLQDQASQRSKIVNKPVFVTDDGSISDIKKLRKQNETLNKNNHPSKNKIVHISTLLNNTPLSKIKNRPDEDALTGENTSQNTHTPMKPGRDTKRILTREWKKGQTSTTKRSEIPRAREYSDSFF